VAYWPTPTHQDTYVEQPTGEFRFESALPAPFNFVAGVFYQNQRVKRPLFMSTPGLDAASGGLYGTDLLFQSTTNVSNPQYAGFANFTYQPTEHWDLSAGLRKAHLQSNFSVTSEGYLSIGETPSSKTTQSPLTKRFVATYKFDNKNMAYASAAEGFRNGGENFAIGGICAPELAGLGFPTTGSTPYGSDSLWSYEVGAKNLWLNDRLSTRVAAYFIDWSKIQQSLTLASCGISIIANSGAAQIKGGEWESVNDTEVVPPATIRTCHADRVFSGGFNRSFVTWVTV
jgi:outer membrane receptor protein involved in Fe transport